MTNTIIEMRHLSHRYRTFQRAGGWGQVVRDLLRRRHLSVQALDDLTITIQKGEMVGILGPNGAGKTTILKVLSGLIHPFKGEVRVLGYMPYRKESSFLRRIGVTMGQKSQLQWDLPAFDTLNLLRCIYNLSLAEFKTRLDQLVTLLDLKERLYVPVRNLSLGERMKFEIGASLLHQPEVLFLDEPTIGLDAASQRQIRSFLKSITKLYRTTVLVTSHYMRDIEALADRVIVINQGRLIFQGTPAGLIARCPLFERILFRAAQKPEIPGMEIALEEGGEYSVACSSAALTSTLRRLVQDASVQSLRTQSPTLEDAMIHLLEEEGC